MEYNQGTLMEDKLPDNPFLLFKEWINGAQIKDPDYYNAMVLSTVNSQLKSDSRVVLLKDFNEEGFVFFSNWESRKGLQIKQNPNVGLNFFWKDWERQVRVQGKIHRLDAADEDDYFATRPFESQIGAWVSKQSEVLSSREEMDNLFVNLSHANEGKTVNRPGYWGGFRVVPENIEFWQGRPNRLNDRILFTAMECGLHPWKIERLSP